MLVLRYFINLFCPENTERLVGVCFNFKIAIAQENPSKGICIKMLESLT